MALDRDLNLESIREGGYVRFLFEQTPPSSDPVRYRQCLMEELTVRGQYKNHKEFLEGYLTWQNEMYRSRN